jgi:hypothetical protein
MSYSVAGMVRDFRPADYPDDEPMVPHGMSVVVNAPAAFRLTAKACPERHLYAAECAGADVRDAAPGDSGEILARYLAGLMRETGMPNGYWRGYDSATSMRCRRAERSILTNAPTCWPKD